MIKYCVKCYELVGFRLFKVRTLLRDNRCLRCATIDSKERHIKWKRFILGR